MRKKKKSRGKKRKGGRGSPLGLGVSRMRRQERLKKLE